MRKEKISAFQFFVMLFLSRMLTTVTYISSYTKDIRLADMLVQPIFRIVIGTVIMIPIYILYKKHSHKNVIDLTREQSGKASKFISVLYAAIFLYFTVITIARLDLFAGTVVFPETDVDYMLVLAIVLSCYGAVLGFEALGRSSVLSAILVIPALLFIFAGLIKKVDLLNFTPIFYNGVAPVLKTAIDSVGQTVEYAIIGIAIPKVSGKIKKGFFLWLIAQIVIMAIMVFFTMTVMGNYAGTQLFPFHTLTSLAEFTMFDRLDAVFTSVWILGAFIKAGLLICLQADMLSAEFPKISRQGFIVVSGVLTVVLTLFVSKEIQRFSYIDSSIIKTTLTFITAFLIPLIVLLSKWGDKKCVKL